MRIVSSNNNNSKIYILSVETDYCKKCVYVLCDNQGIYRCSKHFGTSLMPETCPIVNRIENIEVQSLEKGSPNDKGGRDLIKREGGQDDNGG